MHRTGSPSVSRGKPAEGTADSSPPDLWRWHKPGSRLRTPFLEEEKQALVSSEGLLGEKTHSKLLSATELAAEAPRSPGYRKEPGEDLALPPLPSSAALPSRA